MQMPGRNGDDGNSYRYGFQGQEKDDEIKGEGNSVNYKYRMHDPRIGRFFAVDPLAAEYPFYSPYAFSGNQVIHMVELEGLEPSQPRYKWEGSKGYASKGDKYKQDNSITSNNIMYVEGYEVLERRIYDNASASMHLKYYYRDKETKQWGTFTPTAPSCTSCEMKDGMNSLISYWGNVWDKFASGFTTESGWEGGHDPTGANESGDGGNRRQEIAVGTGVVAILAAPFTAGTSLRAIGFTTLSVLNGVDDVASNNKGESGLQQMFPKYSNGIGKGKVVLTGLSMVNGVANFSQAIYKEGVLQGVQLLATGNDAVSMWNSLVPTAVDEKK
jgi:RHS repeat-associated protein